MTAAVAVRTAARDRGAVGAGAPGQRGDRYGVKIDKVDRCALVASILASDPRKHDEIGREIAQGISDIFARQREEMVQPVAKEDVAELLRRRLLRGHMLVLDLRNTL